MPEERTFSQLVVIGSSAGGIEALSRLVSTLPENFQAPIVVAQHLDPERASHLEQILSRRSTLPVRTVSEHEPLEAGVIFVVPANRHVNITDSEIDLRTDSRGRPMPSIDLLFSSAAASFGERLIAVILTGTGSDGTEGARVVRKAGGMVMIQDPTTAEFGDVPGSLAPNTVGVVAELERIGPVLGDLVSGAEVPEAAPQEDEKRTMERFLEELRERHGIDFTSYKMPTTMRRLRRRMVVTGSESIKDYAAYLNKHPREYRQLVNTFLIKVTEFFRREVLAPDDNLLQTAALVGRQIGQFAERRRAERDRDRSLVREREARRQLASILESINDAFFAVDREWRLTYVNRRAEQLWSKPREELLGENLWEQFPQAADSELYCAIHRAMAEGITTGFEATSPATGTWIAGRAYPSPDGISVYFEDVTERKKVEEERERLRALESVTSAQIAERERISRVLHDRVAHSMGVVHQNLQLYEVLAERDPSRADSKLERAKEMAKVALDSTRNLSAELRRSEAEDNLTRALRDLLEVAVPPGIQARLSVEGDESLVPGHVRGQLFLILREVVRNAVTHSGCSRIKVGLEIIPDKVVGSVEDDGRGFDAEGTGSASVGLRSMKERTALLGGEFRLAPEPGAGTKVVASIPLARER